MGQKLRDDKIGALSQSVGAITMTGSVSVPTWITIGGLQYRLTAGVSRTIATDVTMTANTLYMVYAVLVSGSVELRISTNVNSVGPAGFTSWKLVGAFYADGSVTPVFGAFITIEGVPTTQSSVLYAPTNPTNATVNRAVWHRDGMFMRISSGWTYTNTGSTTFAKANIVPINTNIDGTKLGYYTSVVNRSVVGNLTGVDIGVAGYPGNFVYDHGADNFFVYLSNSGFTFGNTDVAGLDINIPIVGWTSTPLKDL